MNLRFCSFRSSRETWEAPCLRSAALLSALLHLLLPMLVQRELTKGPGSGIHPDPTSSVISPALSPDAVFVFRSPMCMELQRRQALPRGPLSHWQGPTTTLRILLWCDWSYNRVALATCLITTEDRRARRISLGQLIGHVGRWSRYSTASKTPHFRKPEGHLALRSF